MRVSVHFSPNWVESYRSLEHGRWSPPQIIVIQATALKPTEFSSQPGSSRGWWGKLGPNLLILSLSRAWREDRAFLQPGPLPPPPGPEERAGARAGAGGHLWAGTKLSLSPSGPGRTDTSRRGCWARGPQARAATEAPAGPRARGRTSTTARHVVSIATAAPAAKLSHAQRTLKVRGHLCGNTNFPRYGGSDGPLLSHCAGKTPALRGASVAAGPGNSGLGAHWKEDRASPSYPSSRGSGRLGIWRGSGHRGTRLLPGRRSAPQRRPALGWQKAKDHRGSGKRGALPQAVLLPDLVLQTPAPGLRPQRPSALHL